MLIDIKFPRDENVPYIQIDAHDTWSMDSRLAEIVAPMLRQLKGLSHGIPNEFAGPDPDHSDQYVFDFIDRDKEFNEGCERWNQTLDEMIWTFEQLARNGWDLPGERVPYYMTKAHHQRIQDGLNLFAKYYGNLWD